MSALVGVATRLDRLLRRLSRDLLRPDSPFKEWHLPDFPLAKEFLAAGPLTQPFFWGRFDVFERADGGLAVLEYNCDKPAGQREIWATAMLGQRRTDPNRGARAVFRQALVTAWRAHTAGRARLQSPRVAILIDPSHSEEFRLAYLYGREIASLGWRWTVAGPENIRVEGHRALVHGEPIDIVLRQYPAEFLHELPAMADLWKAIQAGTVLMLNDPRAVVTQSKSLLALAWKLALAGRLRPIEASLVRAHVPPTGLAAESPWLAHAEARPEDWVIKPAVGRYSQGVALGALCNSEDWQRALAAAAARPYDYVVQAYVPPRRRWLPAPGGARAGYVNWGVALAGGRFAGLCPRFQPTALTEEHRVWWAPFRIGRPAHRRPHVRWPRPETVAEIRRHRARPDRRWCGPGSTALDIADRGAMAGYTSAWTNGVLNFSVAAIELHRADWDEVSHATVLLGRAITRALASLNDPAVVELLGIPRAVARLVVAPPIREPLQFLSRFDWARTVEGGWRLLEINSDTPAGLWEADLVAREIVRIHRFATSPSVAFGETLAETWRAAVTDTLGVGALERAIAIGLVGFLGSPEDHDQLRAHVVAARAALPHARLVVGDISELRATADAAMLRSTRLDVLFRYYPLDWFTDTRLAPILDLVASGRLIMLPGAHAVVSQSKAFLVLLHELHRRGFFPPAESAAVRCYVPPTALDRHSLGRVDWVAKPFLEREGRGVCFSTDLMPAARRRLERADVDVVFQERVALASARVPIGSAFGWRTEQRFLVFGVFLAAGRVAGAYTRAGARVTGREAVFLPVLLDGSRS